MPVVVLYLRPACNHFAEPVIHLVRKSTYLLIWCSSDLLFTFFKLMYCYHLVLILFFFIFFCCKHSIFVFFSSLFSQMCAVFLPTWQWGCIPFHCYWNKSVLYADVFSWLSLKKSGLNIFFHHHYYHRCQLIGSMPLASWIVFPYQRSNFLCWRHHSCLKLQKVRMFSPLKFKTFSSYSTQIIAVNLGFWQLEITVWLDNIAVPW